MSAFDAAISVVLEGVAYAFTRVLGKTFNIEKDRARRITENIVIGALVAFFILLAILGVGT